MGEVLNFIGKHSSFADFNIKYNKSKMSGIDFVIVSTLLKKETFSCRLSKAKAKTERNINLIILKE